MNIAKTIFVPIFEGPSEVSISETEYAFDNLRKEFPKCFWRCFDNHNDFWNRKVEKPRLLWVCLVCIFIFCFHFLFSFSENCFHFQKIRILKTCLVWLLKNWFRHFIYSIRMYALENWFRHFNKHLISNKNLFNPSTQDCTVTALHCVEPPLFAGIAPHQQQAVEDATKPTQKGTKPLKPQHNH